MEVIFINQTNNVSIKSALWADRIAAFQEGGLSRKDWCLENGIPQSTFSYWLRKLQAEMPAAEPYTDPIFARLPSEQEICSASAAGHAPVTICLPENIRIEVGADCPTGLMAALLHALKSYA